MADLQNNNDNNNKEVLTPYEWLRRFNEQLAKDEAKLDKLTERLDNVATKAQ